MSPTWLLSIALLHTAACADSSPDAVDLCSLNSALCSLKSFSGLVPVPGGSLFYWYFEPADVDPSLPLVLWIQGGPGSSSMTGLFFEMGPVTLNEDVKIVPRRAEETWASKVPIVFVDSPVGTGWSFAENETAYAKDETEVARDLASFLEQFARLHPSAPTKLILSSESYGGHYLPALGNYLRTHPSAHVLEGITIGDGLTDPITQVASKPDLAFSFGLIDESQRAEARKYASQAVDMVKKGDYKGAADYRGKMEDVVGKASAINLYDIRTTEQYDWMDKRLNQFFNAYATKDMLHIPQGVFFGTSDKVGEYLGDDIMRSQKPHVETVLAAGVPVLLYQGQFDWKDGVASNEAWISELHWSGVSEFLAAPRTIWHLADGQTAGYWRGYKNLDQVTVIGAGHLVPMNQPLAAVDMLLRFIRKQRPDPQISQRPDVVV